LATKGEEWTWVLWKRKKKEKGGSLVKFKEGGKGDGERRTFFFEEKEERAQRKKKKGKTLDLPEGKGNLRILTIWGEKTPTRPAESQEGREKGGRKLQFPGGGGDPFEIYRKNK